MNIIDKYLRKLKRQHTFKSVDVIWGTSYGGRSYGKSYQKIMNRKEDINRVELLGHVGSTSYFDSCLPPRYANISLSTAIPKNDSEYDVTWHRVTVFQNMCEVDIREIKSGDRLHITGRIRIQRYTGADGTERRECEVIATGCRKCEE